LQPVVRLLEADETIAQPVTRARTTRCPSRRGLFKGLPVFFAVVRVADLGRVGDPR
jgi:hypothetical protein